VDFVNIVSRQVKDTLEIYPDFVVGRTKDLMTRGRSFYAVWDEENGVWSTDEYDIQRFVDAAIIEAARNNETGLTAVPKVLRSFSSKTWVDFRKMMQNVSDNYRQLDNKIVFSNTEIKKTDYASKRLPYPLEEGSYEAWDELLDVLYGPEERKKIEWAIGAVISGDAKKIQKFLVLYGSAGTGKSTILNIIQRLFEGYVAFFDGKALVGNNNSFATEVFRNNPLVAIEHDGDLSKIENNNKFNSIISHESITINEKYKASYDTVINAFLFMGTNKPVKISDAKSGLIRRVIDVRPTGKTFSSVDYDRLTSMIEYELGAIAYHCLQVYKSMGKTFYNGYRPIEMMYKTDVFFNFVEDHHDLFVRQDGITLRQAYSLYKEYATDTNIEYRLAMFKFREELKNYFKEYHEKFVVDEEVYRHYYRGFKVNMFKSDLHNDVVVPTVELSETTSLLDDILADMPAQYANNDGFPVKYWTDAPRLRNGKEYIPKTSQIVNTVLRDIDTSKMHYVKVPENHIVIDFDLKDEHGAKSLERNLEAASKLPPTYAELSKSGAGVHLHYTYAGDVHELAREYADGIEVKVFTGESSLRRRLSRCNNQPIAVISSGLPHKEMKVLQSTVMQSEKGLRDLIGRNLRKEIHPGTKPSMDFIHKILEDAYSSGMTYDVTDLRSKLLAFANNSTNQALACLKLVQSMKFKSETVVVIDPPVQDTRLVFYDVEVYPNLFVVCWKYQRSPEVVRMVNPTASEIEKLFKMRLVGFNNRRYDNHIMYARFLGYDNEMLFRLSQRVINNTPSAMFGEAYNLSYADIYDFSSIKQSLKKFQIQLGLHHVELDLPWDQPVDETLWPKVVEYCVNDVISTEATFEARKADFVAREILADLSGLSINDTTQKHTARIILGTDKNPQREFVYTKLDKMFPGYTYDRGKSTYKGEDVGEGGYVYAEPGMYEKVALLDVASMHPTSIEQLNLFGPYTQAFTDLKQARLAIKHKDYETARSLLGGKLAKYLGNPEDSEGLAYALKIVINIVYGLTSAKFDNAFRDVRNIDNIVAKRGALFMIDLKEYVQSLGYTVAHIKTDSIKIPDADDLIIEEIMRFGEKYGYTFEHEATYDKFCLVNDAVYIARKTENDKLKWTAVGAQFSHPYVYKTLFTHEETNFFDMCEAKQVTQGSMYLDFEHTRPDPTVERMQFIGRTGLFVPVKENYGGGVLYRVKEGKHYAVTGTKGYLWIEAEMAKDLPTEAVNEEYFLRLVKAARDTIDYYGPFADFVR